MWIIVVSTAMILVVVILRAVTLVARPFDLSPGKLILLALIFAFSFYLFQNRRR